MASTSDSLLLLKQKRQRAALKKECIMALEKREFSVAIKILKKNPRLVNMCLGNKQVPALFYVATSEKLEPEVVLELLKIGANPNPTEMGMSVLDRFIRTGYIYYMLQKSSFINGKTYVHFLQCIELLAEAGGQYDKNLFEELKNEFDSPDSKLNYDELSKNILGAFEKGRKVFEKAQNERKNAFLMGAHPRLGVNSAIKKVFIENELSDFNNLCRHIFKFL